MFRKKKQRKQALMKNTYADIIFSLKKADSCVKIANLNKSRKIGNIGPTCFCKGMLPEHLKL